MQTKTDYTAILVSMAEDRYMRTPRTERATTSCGECRRRKQRCDQGRPCSNCSKRYPQPTCAYRQNRHRAALPSPSSTDLAEQVQLPMPHLIPLSQQAPSLLLSADLSLEYAMALQQWDVFIDAAAGNDLLGLHTDDGPCADRALGDLASTLLRRQVLDDAFQVLLAADDSMDGLHTWLRMLTWASPGQTRHGTKQHRQGSNGSSLTCLFLSCLDDSLYGSLDPLETSTRVFVPCCLETPSLARVALHASTCFLYQTGHLAKGAAAPLHQPAAAFAPTGDDAVAARVQLLMDEWYTGRPDYLQAHLQEVVRLRGGLPCLATGRLATLAIYITAIQAPDMATVLPFEAGPHRETPAPVCVAYNSPFAATLPSFAQSADALALSLAAASILDDMRFLISAVLALPETPSAKDLQKIQTTARWTHDRIQHRESGGPGEEQSDPWYEAVRQTALVYTRAILLRRPLSHVVAPHELGRLWLAAWRVSLTDYRRRLGVFLWVILSVVSSVGRSPKDCFRLVKSMLSLCAVQMSLECWDVAVDVLRAALILNVWLSGT